MIICLNEQTCFLYIWRTIVVGHGISAAPQSSIMMLFVTHFTSIKTVAASDLVIEHGYIVILIIFRKQSFFNPFHTFSTNTGHFTPHLVLPNAFFLFSFFYPFTNIL